MAIQFNDTSTYKGQVQLFEKAIGAPRGFVSGDTDRLKEFAAEANIAQDDFNEIAHRFGGTWQSDDTNHTKHPIITTNIVSGQRDYVFGTDEQGNQIQSIHKVFVADSSGTFHELNPVDVQSEEGLLSFQTSTGGMPVQYDKTGNAIFLDPIPNYNYTNGLKLYITREPSYFAYSDTTKKAGIPSQFHKYIYLKAALSYGRNNSISNFQLIKEAVEEMEGDEARGLRGTIGDYFSSRNKDERKRLSAGVHDNR